MTVHAKKRGQTHAAAFLVIVLALAGCRSARPPATPATGARLYGERLLACLDTIEANTPQIVATAERAANLYVLENYSFSLDAETPLFSEAFVRSGGLMRLGQENAADKRVILCTQLDGQWEALAAKTVPWHKAGHWVIALGRADQIERARSRGAHFDAVALVPAPPEGGLYTAPDGRRIIALDAPVKMALFWVWLGEFVGACTREGKMPPLYQGYAVPGGRERAERIGVLTKFHAETPIPVEPGRVTRHYLASVRRSLRKTIKQEGAIARTAERAIAARRAGKGVYALLEGHSVSSRLGGPDDPGAFTPIGRWNTPNQPAPREGDFLFYMGYDTPPDLVASVRSNGVNVAWSLTDYKKERIRQIPPDEPFINQHWAFGDAVVEMPGYDIPILPASGVIAEAVLGMVQAEIHDRLSRFPRK